MIAVVITTGNHYVLDVVGSALLLTTSIAAAAVWGRWLRARQDDSRTLAPPVG
jgi:hypothetical protein